MATIIAQSFPPDPSTAEPENGTRAERDGTEYVYYDGYWVRYYKPLRESLGSRKKLIDSLNRRTFHHTEPGINTPGYKLERAREAWEAQNDPALKRVNAAMLAGALFNRATDLFTKIVELEECGVTISRDNELMRACGECFKEALELGQHVRHHSGEEGIDELWGEPFKAFTLPIEQYYESRFIKVAQTMANIDSIAATLIETLAPLPGYEALPAMVETFAVAAREECETMKADACIFDIWPRFVASGEALGALDPQLPEGLDAQQRHRYEQARRLLVRGRNLINWVARARVPMPKSTRDLLDCCELFRQGKPIDATPPRLLDERLNSQ